MYRLTHCIHTHIDVSQVPCFTRDAMRDIPGHKHRFHHLGMVQSMPPAMLGAALRAHQAQPGSTGASSGSSSSEPGRQLAGSGSSSWSDAIADSIGGSSSSRRGRALAQVAAPQPPAAGVQQAAGTDTGAAAPAPSVAAAAAVSEALRLLSLPVWHQSQPSSSSRGTGQWQYRAHNHLESGAKRLKHPVAWDTLDSLSSSSSSRRLKLLQSGKEEGFASHTVLLSSSSRRLLQPGDGDDLNPAHTEGDTGMEADPMADRDGDVNGDSSDAAAAAAAAGEGLQGDDMGRPVVAAAAAAGSWGTLPGTGGARDPAADLLVGPKGPPKRPELRHVGVPVFFHRTSFNSKFFPDCLNADKIKTRYCEVRVHAMRITGGGGGGGAGGN
jgi:hypothetical protein